VLLETYRRFLFCNITHSVCACLRFPNLEHTVIFASGGLRSTISDCEVTHFTPHNVPMQPLLPEHGDLQKVSLFQHLCLLYHRSLALYQSYFVVPHSLGTCGVGGLPLQCRTSSVLDVRGRCLRHSPFIDCIFPNPVQGTQYLAPSFDHNGLYGSAINTFSSSVLRKAN